jgi:hypothetical protein
VHSIERPFLGAFLPYYLDELGFDRIFMVHGEEADPAWLQAWIASGPYADRVEILYPPAGANIDEVMLDFLPMIARRCDWVQLTDIDEYTYLGGQTIAGAMARHEAMRDIREVHWRWLMMPTLDLNPGGYAEIIDSSAIFPKKFTKTIFRPQGVRTMSTHQGFWRRPLTKDQFHIHEIRKPADTACFQFHFCGRGMLDTLLKSVRQRFGEDNPKTANIDVLKRFLARRGDVADAKEVPTRFLVLMIQMKEDKSALPMAPELREIGRRILGTERFDTGLLVRMLDEALIEIGVPPKTRQAIFDGDLLAESMERITARFFKPAMLPELKTLNYIKTIKKMRGEPY